MPPERNPQHSVADYLVSIGEDPRKKARAILFEQHGLGTRESFTGTEEQNIALLASLKAQRSTERTTVATQTHSILQSLANALGTITIPRPTPATPPSVTIAPHLATTAPELPPDIRYITSTKEAIALVQNPPPADGRLHLITLRTPDQALLARHQTPIAKEYAIIHGSSSPTDKSLINTGVDTGLFAYAVTRTGWVVNFFPDNTGIGAISGKGMLNSDPKANSKGIAIEFSGKPHPTIAGEVEEPNLLQTEAGKKLLADIAKRYPDIHVSTSWLAVEGQNNVHGDTRTWDKRIFQALGVDPMRFARRSTAPTQLAGTPPKAPQG